MTNTNPARHDVLVHYTDAQGLEGILSNNTLWATHGSCTNDGKELQIGLEVLERFWETAFWDDEKFEKCLIRQSINIYQLKVEEQRLGAKNFWEERLKELCQLSRQAAENVDTYLISFSQTKAGETYIQKNGRLSQWRAYGDYGIVFRQEEFEQTCNDFRNPNEPELDGGRIITAPVVYFDPEEKINSNFLFYEDFYNHISLCQKMSEFKSELVQQPIGIHYTLILIESFLKIFFAVKDKGFEEESEYRLILTNGRLPTDRIPNVDQKSTGNRLREKNRRTFIRRNRIVPYTDFFAPKTPLPIEKILIGPAPEEEQQRRKAGVDILLRRLGKEHIDVHCSAIPYRG
jgi:hypothetical protein